MTSRDEIIALAGEAGLDDWFWLNPDDPDFPDEMKVIEAFFHAAQRQAYERAAEVCDGIGFDGDTMGMSYANGCAISIRALIEDAAPEA